MSKREPTQVEEALSIGALFAALGVWSVLSGAYLWALRVALTMTGLGGSRDGVVRKPLPAPRAG